MKHEITVKCTCGCADFRIKTKDVPNPKENRFINDIEVYLICKECGAEKKVASI